MKAVLRSLDWLTKRKGSLFTWLWCLFFLRTALNLGSQFLFFVSGALFAFGVVRWLFEDGLLVTGRLKKG